MIRRSILSLAVLALAASSCAYESSGTTTTTILDPSEVPPATGPADLEFRDQQTDGAVVEVAQVAMPSDGFVVLYDDRAGAPGEVIGVSNLLSSGVIASVPVAFFVPLEEGTVVHAQIHIDMDRDESFTYEPPDAFIDVPATFANGEVAAASAEIGLLPPVSPGQVAFAEQRTTGDSVVVASVELPAAGFLVIRDDDFGDPGRVLAVSDLLPAGVSTDVEVAFDEPLEISGVLFASAYVDRDQDSVLTLGEGAVDRIAQGEDGAEATVGVPVTVVPLTPVRLAVDDVEAEETEVAEFTATVTLPASGFAVLSTDEGGAPGETLAVSRLLEIGSNEVTFAIDPAVTEDTTLWVTVFIDLDGNGEYDGDEPQGVLEAGGPAEASLDVTFPEEEDGDGGS